MMSSQTARIHHLQRKSRRSSEYAWSSIFRRFWTSSLPDARKRSNRLLEAGEVSNELGAYMFGMLHSRLASPMLLLLCHELNLLPNAFELHGGRSWFPCLLVRLPELERVLGWQVRMLVDSRTVYRVRSMVCGGLRSLCRGQEECTLLAAAASPPLQLATLLVGV